MSRTMKFVVRAVATAFLCAANTTAQLNVNTPLVRSLVLFSVETFPYRAKSERRRLPTYLDFLGGRNPYVTSCLLPLLNL